MSHWTSPGILAALAALATLATPAARAETPPEFLYVTNFGDHTVSAFRVDAPSGALVEVPGSPFASGNDANDLVIDPSNRFLYVIRGDATTLSGFAIAADGALTPLPGSPFPTTAPGGASDLWSGAVDPSGRFLYASDALFEKVRGYLIDPSTGALSLMPGSGFPLANNADGICVHPSGRFAYGGGLGGTDGVSAYTIDEPTGALTRVAGTPVSVGGLWQTNSTVDASGRYLYVTNGQTSNVSAFWIHPTTGYPNWIANVPAGAFPSGVAITPSARFVYVANAGTSNVSAYALDGATGGLTPVAGSPFAAGSASTEVVVHPTSRFAYTANNGGASVSAYAIGSDGALSPIMGSPFAAGMGPSAIAMTSHDAIFADGFDSATLDAWSLANTDGGDLAATAAAALHGTHGLAAVVDDTAPLFVTDETPADEDRYRTRFLIHTNGYDPGTGQGHLRTRVLIGLGTGGLRPRVFALVLRLREGQYAVSARVLVDDGTRAETAFVPITNLAPHALQLDWRRASGPDAADGSFELFVDDLSAAALTGLDNHAAGIDGVRLGAMAVKAGAAGELRFDRFESKRYNFIWPAF